MKTGGKINFAVAKISLVALLASFAAADFKNKIRNELRSVAPYHSTFQKYASLEAAYEDLSETVREKDFRVDDLTIDSISEEAYQAIRFSLVDRETRFNGFVKARDLTSNDIHTLATSKEYKLAKLEREEIEGVVAPIGNIQERYCNIGLLLACGSVLAAGMLREFT